MTLKEYMEFEKAEACAEACEEARIRGHAEGHAEGRAEGRAEGHAEAREEGILILVSMLREMNISDEEITKKLVEKYGLSAKEAKAYLKN